MSLGTDTLDVGTTDGIVIVATSLCGADALNSEIDPDPEFATAISLLQAAPVGAAPHGPEAVGIVETTAGVLPLLKRVNSFDALSVTITSPFEESYTDQIGSLPALTVPLIENEEEAAKDAAGISDTTNMKQIAAVIKSDLALAFIWTHLLLAFLPKPRFDVVLPGLSIGCWWAGRNHVDIACSLRSVPPV